MKLVAVLLVAVLGIGLLPATAEEPDEQVQVTSGALTATIGLEPFSISFAGPGGAELASLPAGVDPADPANAYGPLGFAVDVRFEAITPGGSYGIFVEAPLRWFHATRVVDHDGSTFVVETDDPLGRTFMFTVEPDGDGIIAVSAELDDISGVAATGAAFARGDGERYLGFGERSDGVDQTGQRVENWTEEGPWSGGAFKPVTEPELGDRWQGPEPFPGTNYPVPWFVSSRGYGFLLDSTWLNAFEMASDRDDAWRVETREPALAYRVYAGPTPADVVERFSADTGRQPEPAEWFFGPWYQPTGSGEFKDSLMSFWREQDVPVTVSQRYGHYLPCGRKLNLPPEGRRALTDAYHRHGYKVTTYVNQFVCSEHPDGRYSEGEEHGHFVQTQLRTTYPMFYLAYPDQLMGMVDFTSPDASRWWQEMAAEAIDDGFDGWMEDFGEYIPPDAQMADGRHGVAAHNDYCTHYHRASHELTAPRRGKDFAQYVRCGYTGTAEFARIVWGGDPVSDYSKADGLAAAISQGQSMGLSGVAYWGTDIGGFHALFDEHQTDAELMIRWLEYGAFNGVMRTQAEGYPRPYQDNERAQMWDDDVLPHWRKYTKLRTQLFPYIWEAAEEYQRTGMPIIRHLALAYPDDPRVYDLDAEFQFLFGPDLLVAPVIEEGATERTAYLPEGDWVHFWSAVDYDEATGAFTAREEQEVMPGGDMVTVDAPLGEVPLFVRAGTCLDLLPAETDTLADVGDLPGLVRLDDVADQRVPLCVAAAASADGGEAETDAAHPVQPASNLPATGGGSPLALVLVAAGAAGLRRRQRLGR